MTEQSCAFAPPPSAFAPFFPAVRFLPLPTMPKPMNRVPARSPRASASRQLRRHRQPHPLGVSLARFTSIAAMCGALVAGGATAQAATYYWDADGNPVLNATNNFAIGGTG